MNDERERDLLAHQPGDHYGRLWPSDELRNLSADARVLAHSATEAFRKALKDQPND